VGPRWQWQHVAFMSAGAVGENSCIVELQLDYSDTDGCIRGVCSDFSNYHAARLGLAKG
jgi:hypothetical protein